VKPLACGGEDFRVQQNIATGRVQVHPHVVPEVRAELLEVARANDRSVSSVIRIAIAEHLEREHLEREWQGDD